MKKIEDYEIFREHMESLKELSKDTSEIPNQYMTLREDKAVNFDLVKRIYTNALGLSEETAASCDCILAHSGAVAMIEFKNGRVKNGEVKTKVRDSLLIYSGITGEGIAETREGMEFILVYNEEKNPDRGLTHRQASDSPSRVSIAGHVARKAKREHIRFDLERFRALYFHEVHTYTPEEFESYLVRNGFR